MDNYIDPRSSKIIWYVRIGRTKILSFDNFIDAIQFYSRNVEDGKEKPHIYPQEVKTFD